MKIEKPNYLSVDDIKQMKDSLLEKEQALYFEIEQIRLTRLALDEIDRGRHSAKKGSIALDWESFCIDVEEKDQEIAAILKEVELQRFDFPRIWIDVPKHIDLEKQTTVNFRLKRFLEVFTAGKYGQPFRVRIKRDQA